MALVVLAAALAGCVSYRAQPLQPARSAEEFAARRLDAPELRAEVARMLPQSAQTWPPAAWDRAQLLAVALVNNRQLAVARAQVQASVAHAIAAAETPNPTLTLQSEYARHDPHPWLYGVSMDLLLRSPQRRRLDVERARLATGSARWQLIEQTWTVRRTLVGAISDWESANRRADLLDRLAAEQQRLESLLQERVKAGEDGPGELVSAHIARLETEQQQAQASSDRANAQAAAAGALGLPLQALDELRLTWADWGEPAPIDAGLQAAREQALLARADLAATIDDYAEAEVKLQQAVARQYPQLQMSPGYYWDHGIAKFPLDLSFSFPIFNRNQGEIAEAHAARELAAQRMLALQADIYAQIAAAERAQDITAQSVDAAARSLQDSRRQEQHAELGLRLGAIGVVEHAGARTVALRAELEALHARAQLQAARNALEDALHTPLSGPELMLQTAMIGTSGADQ